MVKKLFKHEIRSYLRVIIPVQIILLGVALLARILQLFESNTTMYNIVHGSSVFAFVVAMVATLAMTTILSVVRFYRHLFTGEGYLTFTLPVTSTQHLTVKLLTAMLFQIVNFLVAVLAVCIITAGDVLVELLRAGDYLWNQMMAELGKMSGHVWLYLVEGVFALLAVLTAYILLFYLCISIGQLFNKNRVLAAVGVYFGFYAITQVICTVGIALVAALMETAFIKTIAKWIEGHPYASVHIALCSLLVISAVLAVVYFLVNRYIISRKLNLE